MREIANLELAAMVKELNTLLAGARLQKFYELGENEFRTEFHATGKGTLDLAVELKQRINITKFIKPAPEKPTPFAMSMRKHLEGAVVEAVGQYGLDRVIYLEFKAKEGKKRLIFEMFSNGNLILTGDADKTINCYRGEEWSDRTIKRGIKYAPPSSTKINPSGLTPDKLKSILNEKKLISCLAGKITLGSSYLEEAIARAGLDLGKQASRLTADETASLANAIAGIMQQAESPSPTAYYTDGKLSDYSLFPLRKYEGIESKQFPSFSELLDEAYSPGQVEAPKVEDKFAEEKKKLEFTLKTQQEAVGSLRKRAEEAKLAGDKVYERYSEIEELLKMVLSARKANKPWEEIERELKGKASINREKGTITFEL